MYKMRKKNGRDTILITRLKLSLDCFIFNFTIFYKMRKKNGREREIQF